MKKAHLSALLLAFLVTCTFSSCAPAGYTSKEHGFLSGLVHGLVFVFALVGKLLGMDVGLYATHNTGFFYWLGFIIGIGGLGGGGRKAVRG